MDREHVAGPVAAPVGPRDARREKRQQDEQHTGKPPHDLREDSGAEPVARAGMAVRRRGQQLFGGRFERLGAEQVGGAAQVDRGRADLGATSPPPASPASAPARRAWPRTASARSGWS